MISDPNDSTAANQDNDADDCLCGVNHAEEDGTSDEELPIAIGGIQIQNKEEADDDNGSVDGCDIDFAAEDQTIDEELPITVGGI